MSTFDHSNLSKEKTKTFVKIIKKKFLNLYKIFSKTDIEEASVFLKKNQYYKEEVHDK